jgi:hypothetical protein
MIVAKIDAHRRTGRGHELVKREALSVAFVQGDGVRSVVDDGDDLTVALFDAPRVRQEQAIGALRKNDEFNNSIRANGIPWGKLIGLLKEALPETMDDRDSVAYNLVPQALNAILGPQNEAWSTERRGPKNTLFVVKQ